MDSLDYIGIDFPYLLLISALTFGRSGIIKGIVKDQSGEIEFANVALTEAADTAKIVSAAVTDSLGKL